MKSPTYLILFLSICFLSNNVYSQYEIGIRGGGNKVWQNYGDVETPDDAEIHINGRYISVFVYKQLGNRTSIGIEPTYTKKGARCVPGFQDPFIGDAKIFLRYMEAPVFLKYDLPIEAEKINLYGKIGYGAAFLHKAFAENLFSNIKEAPQIVEVELGKPFSDNGPFNRFEHSGYSGLGVSFVAGRIKFNVEGNYTYGLSNASRRFDSSNRGLSLGLGYSYSF